MIKGFGLADNRDSIHKAGLTLRPCVSFARDLLKKHRRKDAVMHLPGMVFRKQGMHVYSRIVNMTLAISVHFRINTAFLSGITRILQLVKEAHSAFEPKDHLLPLKLNPSFVKNVQRHEESFMRMQHYGEEKISSPQRSSASPFAQSSPPRLVNQMNDGMTRSGKAKLHAGVRSRLRRDAHDQGQRAGHATSNIVMRVNVQAVQNEMEFTSDGMHLRGINKQLCIMPFIVSRGSFNPGLRTSSGDVAFPHPMDEDGAAGHRHVLFSGGYRSRPRFGEAADPPLDYSRHHVSNVGQNRSLPAAAESRYADRRIGNEIYFRTQHNIETEIGAIKKSLTNLEGTAPGNSPTADALAEKEINSRFDIHHITDKVYDEIGRRIRVERERRGL